MAKRRMNAMDNTAQLGWRPISVSELERRDTSIMRHISSPPSLLMSTFADPPNIPAPHTVLGRTIRCWSGDSRTDVNDFGAVRMKPAQQGLWWEPW